MSYENPTTDSSPKNLLFVCEGLNDGARSIDNLAEDEDIGLSKGVVSEVIKYGDRLGFISESEEGKYKLTDRGWEAAFTDEIDDTLEEEFRKGVQEHSLYSDLLELVIDDGLVEERMENTITQKQILPHLNRNFGFSELSTDSTLKPATNVFLKTLEAAGYGNYVVGRGGNPTRLEVQESLLNIQQEVDQDLDENPAEGSEDRAEIEQPTLEDSATEIIQQKEAKEEEETKQDKEVSFEEDVVAEPSIKKPEQDPNTDLIEISEQIEQDSSIDLQINIEISSSDWESESVIALIEKLQSK